MPLGPESGLSQFGKILPNFTPEFLESADERKKQNENNN
jgi:hypothetical protein